MRARPELSISKRLAEIPPTAFSAGKGGTLRHRLRDDGDANENLYGRKLTAREIVRGGAAPAQSLIDLLNKRSPTNRSERTSSPVAAGCGADRVQGDCGRADQTLACPSVSRPHGARADRSARRP